MNKQKKDKPKMEKKVTKISTPQYKKRQATRESSFNPQLKYNGFDNYSVLARIPYESRGIKLSADYLEWRAEDERKRLSLGRSYGDDYKIIGISNADEPTTTNAVAKTASLQDGVSTKKGPKNR